MSAQYAVIGTSPFNDTSVAVGPFRSIEIASAADAELTSKGWNTEMVTLERLEDIGSFVNEEGW